MLHFEVYRRSDDLREQCRHVLVGVDDSMEGEVLARVLDDHEGPMIVNAVVMPGSRRAHLLVEFRAMEQRLAHLHEVRLSFHLEAQTFADAARSAVAANYVAAVNAE